MASGMRISVRQRYPETGKELSVVRTYDKYALFEAMISDGSHPKGTGPEVITRTQELIQESAKTIEALQRKQTVRIPVLKSKEKAENMEENGMKM